MLSKFSKFAFAVFFGCSMAFALDVPDSKIVDVKWLLENLDDKDLVIIDLREEKKDYKAEHIANAIHWAVDDFREVRMKTPGYIGSPTAFKRLASKSGITQDSAIVFYSDAKEAVSYTIATLGVFVSEYYGLSNTAILNGGFDAWKSAGGEVTKDIPKVAKTKFEITKFNKDIVATIIDMDEAVELKNSVLIDARNDKQYSGEAKHKKANKAGHVPGASHLFIANFAKKDGDIFYINTDKDAVSKALVDAKVDITKPNIWYCNTGWFASGGWFATKYIAKLENTRVYEASMLEYSQMPKRKMLKSKE